MSTAGLTLRVLRRWGDVALWIGSIVGVLCMLVAIAGLLFDVRPLVFRSGSMSPSIETGALALSQKVSGEDLRKGDVISVVNANDVRITHRIQQIQSENGAFRVILKGDANPTADTEPYRVDSAYRVFGDVPKLGYVANALTQPIAIFAGGILVALVLAAVFFPRAGGTRSGAGRRRALSLVLAVGLGSTAAGSVGASKTFAAFSDTSAVTTGAFTPLTVPPPATFTCGGLGIASVTFSWAPVANATSYTVYWNSGASSASTTNTSGTITGASGGNKTAWVVANRAFGSPVTATWSSVASNSRTYSITLGLLGVCS